MTVEESARVELLTEQLLVVLRRLLGDPELRYDGVPTPLTGGFWAELLAFRLQSGPAGWQAALVARVMPDAATAAKETAFQTQVAAQGFPTPAVRAAGGPGEGIDGRAFMVMDLASGRQLLAGLDGLGALVKLPSLARRMPVTLADVLARLHRVDPAPVRHAIDEAGIAPPRLDAMLTSLRDTSMRLGRADLVAAATWLADNPLATEPIVICHGDLHPFNVLVADDSDAVTVLDWSAALLASATYDLGFSSLMLAEPPLLVPRALRPLVRGVGRALMRRFVRAYEQRAGTAVDPKSLEWHQAIVCLRALVEVAGWVAEGTVDGKGGHPWVIAGDAFARRLQRLTGAPVTAR